MYKTLRAEMRRCGLTQKDIRDILEARGIKICLATLSLKMTGNRPFLFREAVAIKDILRSELPLEVLFGE